MSCTCPVCDKMYKTEQAGAAHGDEARQEWRAPGVRAWEDARQTGELTTGAASYDPAYVIDDGDWDGYNNVWRLGPGCAKTLPTATASGAPSPCLTVLAVVEPECVTIADKCHLASRSPEESMPPRLRQAVS